ncbi:hypothetical protein F1188_17385 [Roseospira marina]|uniref:Uncharacterized protein n=1 Tax=Roseospira marina TaxID=140057 RepID=A0A5M6I8L5_9PROT|nr:DUF6447 family protein [Roseospira marina]KAA5604155.1 hypothetical protein F1188_17385 [Roseospira marina]MBB4315748.1 hypothetical protein [Roseospira marina]MBB5088915.1 hypothetical protein [Roseospira marina]
MAEPTTVTIDGTEYALDSLSDTARKLIDALRTADMEIARTQAQVSMFQVARSSYANALKAELDGTA